MIIFPPIQATREELRVEITQKDWERVAEFVRQWRNSKGDYYADLDIHDIELLCDVAHLLEKAERWK
jgi:hypothetical protein